MIAVRARVVAVSNSEQERETLVIMLDPDFDVTAISAARFGAFGTPPAALVVAAGGGTSWEDPDLDAAVARWPEAGLVFVDAPEAVAQKAPHAARASWADPFSVPAAVQAVAAAASAAALEPDLSQTLRSADLALRPQLETVQALSALVLALRRAGSSEIAARFLAEQVGALADQLAWLDWSDAPAETAADPRPAGDLAAALEEALAERHLRARCRGLHFAWQRREPCRLHGSRETALTLMRCLRHALLGLPAGAVSIDSDARRLQCRHDALSDRAASFELDVLACLLQRVGARLRRGVAALELWPEANDALHA